ncbi:protein C8orf37 homolog isoform X2 [Siniperca chuatsi]|uniref:protein C8orf37 homolog isoform X2 n=1 Tax=Siniperca chuatsi TaxID=119488 RepID=UPI001CE039DE|nr:protein C8orf37 homolog isoform X2 [Siniperca chuatsi]
MEDDDLDELLDEVEKKFCSNVSVASSARVGSSEAGKCGKDNVGQKKHSATKSKQPMSSVTEDIDALLEELLEEDYSDSPQLKTEQFPKETQVERKPSSQSGGRKSCDQLRCISCDFRVLMFDDCEWDSSCDYLFLRNNMPDRQKLGAKLKKRRGLRAYACQCSWFSTLEPADLRDQPQLRWVCGKHQD